MLLKFIGTCILAIAILGTQKYLSKKKLWQLGAIVPLISIAVLTAIYFIKQIPVTKLLFPCTLLILSELFIWIDGRHQYRKEELAKMKAKDID